MRFALLLSLAATSPAVAGVVINEVMYHAPNDLDDLQFVELHNPDATPVNLAGYKLGKVIQFTFPAGTTLDAGGYLVVCKDAKLFRKTYGVDAAGQFTGELSHGGDRIELVDATGNKVDAVKYKSRDPWPSAADGYSSSIERICPSGPSDDAGNWVPSPLSTGSPKPTGTPGKKNAACSDKFPPSIELLQRTSAIAAKTPFPVEATVRSPAGVRGVELRYRVAGSGFEKAEQVLAMSPAGNDKFTATIPGTDAGRIVRYRVRAIDKNGGERTFPHEHELRPALSVYVHEPMTPGTLPFGYVINIGEAEFRAAKRDEGRGYGAPPANDPPPQGQSAFVYVRDAKSPPELFDFIAVTPRNAGRKLRFHKDHMLDGMTTVNLIYEYKDRFVLAEPMAYDVYRKCGNAAPRTDFVRTWIDGRPVGYQLLIEQPNKAFLRHIGLRSDGELYKCVWFGDGVVGQHEKKSNPLNGHKDLVDVVEQLKKTRGDNQWAVIKKEFDVEQVINYFAVNMVLSHWDGYFNNYFAYYDTHGSGKWTLYPWDQDKTWGFHDGLGDTKTVFTDMPLTFGMAGDAPPGWPKFMPAPNAIGLGTAWWRPGGHFSKPLLANPTFRKHFLARTKEILETVYTEEVFFPLIDKLGERLADEVRYRATIRDERPETAMKELRANLDLLKEHLTKRRKFLLAQAELQKAGKFDKAEVK